MTSSLGGASERVMPTSPMDIPHGSSAGAERDAWWALGVVASGVLLVALDGTVAAVANPVLAVELGASVSDLQWVTTVYLLALAGTLVLAGRLGDRFGRKNVFLLGVSGFSLASIAIALAPNVEIVILSRGVQGTFGAFVITNALSTLRSMFPKHLLPTALSVFAAVIGASSAAGPVIGGFLVDSLSWRWAFGLNGPLGALSIVLGFRILSQPMPRRTLRIDVLGSLLLSASLIGISYGVIRASETTWADPTSRGCLLAGLMTLVAFVLHQRRHPQPLMPLLMLRNRAVSLGALINLMTYFALIGTMFFLLLFLQHVRGESPLTAGLMLLPMSVANVTGSLLAGPLGRRHGPRRALVVGMLLAALGFLLLTDLSPVGPRTDVLIPLTVAGLGLGLAMTASTQAVLGGASEEYAGGASGIHVTAAQIGGILGLAFLGAVMSHHVSTTFAGELSDAGVGNQAAASLGSHSESLVAQGLSPKPVGMSPVTIESIRIASDATFTTGIAVTMWVSATVTGLGAVVAIFVGRGPVSSAAGTPPTRRTRKR